MDASADVYSGFWTNRSEGRVAGATLTLSTRSGAYLIAFLALFVRFAASNTWQILSYFVFRAKASPGVTDKSTQQLLLILRNASSDIPALWSLIKTSGSAKRRRLSITLFVAAAIHAIRFGAAGIFASNVTAATSEVLLRPSLCGAWRTFKFGSMSTENFQHGILFGEEALKSAHIVSNCYNSSAPLKAACNAYGRRLLEPIVTTSTKCLFDDSICLNTTTVRMDSGFVHSLRDLGINSDPADSVSFRKVVECAPISTEGFSKTCSDKNLTSDVSRYLTSIDQSVEGSRYTAFFYGPSMWSETNATFIFNNASFDASVESTIIPYRME